MVENQIHFKIQGATSCMKDVVGGQVWKTLLCGRYLVYEGLQIIFSWSMYEYLLSIEFNVSLFTRFTDIQVSWMCAPTKYLYTSSAHQGLFRSLYARLHVVTYNCFWTLLPQAHFPPVKSKFTVLEMQAIEMWTGHRSSEEIAIGGPCP